MHDLAVRLRSDGVDVRLEQWHAIPGDQLPRFMETAIRENDFVLVICTSKYKERSDARKGGVGYEGDIITAEIRHERSNRKFIPILRQGQWVDASPSWLLGSFYIDLRGDPYQVLAYDQLLRTIHGVLEKAPPIGASPFGRASIDSPEGQCVRWLAEILAMLDGLEKYLGLSNLCNFWATVSSRDSRLRLQVVKQVVSRTRARLVRYHDCNDPHALLVIDELLKNIDAYIDVCDDILPRLEQPQFGRRANDVQLENLRDTVTAVKNTLPDSGYGSSKIAALLGSRPELHVLFRAVRDDEQVIYPLMGFANRT